MQERHEFAVYYPELSKQIKNVSDGQLFNVVDDTIIGRVTHVLRLRVDESIVFFDDHYSVHCSISSISKKEIQCTLLAGNRHQTITPAITFILPLLKKDDFETALYSLVELGATTIQLVTTEKTQRSWGNDKELDRCRRIMIAAAEQSKNFALPELLAPVPLKSYLARLASMTISKIYFDPQGTPAEQLLVALAAKKPAHCLLMVGPEGDLTVAEKEALQAHAFEFCQLTPTVLRSVQAVAVGLGIVRSLLR
jgi:RsmE family RNA methyltransferase